MGNIKPASADLHGMTGQSALPLAAPNMIVQVQWHKYKACRRPAVYQSRVQDQEETAEAECP